MFKKRGAMHIADNSGRHSEMNRVRLNAHDEDLIIRSRVSRRSTDGFDTVQAEAQLSQN